MDITIARALGAVNCPFFFKRKGVLKMTRRRMPTILDARERAALLAVPNIRCPSGLRNRCILSVMVNAGLRCAEALALRGRDIDWDTGRLTVVNGKGGRSRVVWLNQSDLALLGALRETLQDRAGALFRTSGGSRVDARYVRRMVKRYARRAGIVDKDVHPHVLRHTFATDLYRRTKNLRLVQKALGHASITTTQIYTHVVDEELEREMVALRMCG